MLYCICTLSPCQNEYLLKNHRPPSWLAHDGDAGARAGAPGGRLRDFCGRHPLKWAGMNAPEPLRRRSKVSDRHRQRNLAFPPLFSSIPTYSHPVDQLHHAGPARTREPAEEGASCCTDAAVHSRVKRFCAPGMRKVNAGGGMGACPSAADMARCGPKTARRKAMLPAHPPQEPAAEPGPALVSQSGTMRWTMSASLECSEALEPREPGHGRRLRPRRPKSYGRGLLAFSMPG
eukprot:SAG22_NODE_3489_length_1683_cov_6.269571_2_plen_233_part_00